MREITADIAVVGGGPAGMSAALRACGLGAKTVLIERDAALGGILNQCVHDGFGLLRFKKQMSGSQYAQQFADAVYESSASVMTETTVLKLIPGECGSKAQSRQGLYTTGEKTGGALIRAGAVILAMGCRERPRQQAGIVGSRPAGVLTAGAVQKYINVEGYLPGRKAVILGSGDIGLIMARRMTLEGIDVAGVYEIMPSPGGLRRNVAQCLDDYDIPLRLSSTVTEVHGKKRVEGVTVADVDAARHPIPGTEVFVPCDLLVLSVGLIPENELSRDAGIEMDPVTGGPVLDNFMMASVPGFFAAGNVSAVFDLVDYVSDTGEAAAEGACRFLGGEALPEYVTVRAGDDVSFVLPGKIRRDLPSSALYMRVKRTIENAVLEILADGKPVYEKKHPIVTPPEMVTARFHESAGSGVPDAGGLTVRILGD
ncbi:MAG: NAD(P)/FAD-dependent oxidoreductase [Synergistaceae bacterium]|jgi:NADPH-dependent 2,4-dienoyl-CoA reductase/sulfur reductase-like enzyme|nr:NAD(P)/FAD-dependent oxidoreductase [Synergistaceae bacterium]